MKRIAILGSTGSIGKNALDVIKQHPEQFEVVGLTAGSNVDTLAEQILAHRPKVVSLFDDKKIPVLKEKLKGHPVEILSGESGSKKIASLPEVDFVISAIVGSAGLMPSLAAVRSGKTLALANKETLVAAGEIVLKEIQKNKTSILPIDSEHSAILQALNGEKKKQVKKIVLTASGGPFRKLSLDEMEQVTLKQALKHPNWSMGNKITIDSATMMNKGLEYIEAKWLFGPEMPVEILVHPQSIIHSMVEFMDTSIIAQLGLPDMRVPIAYALSYPERIECDLPSLDLAQVATLTFENPDEIRFPCIRLAREAFEMGDSYPAVINAANETVVSAFLQEFISYKEIPEIIQQTLDTHVAQKIVTAEDALEADRWARAEASRLITVVH